MEQMMTLDPLRQAETIVQIHALMAFAAIGLTIAIFAVKRGTKLHKGLGRVWASAMALVALSSFWIFDLKMWGNYSAIHLLSIYTLVQLFLAVQAARAGNIARHKSIMKQLSFAALGVAGAFTLLPGRIMHQVFLGG